MTTIGTAVLQIIPSLLGVSEEIEKQLDGKVVEVKVAPKVDPAAAKKAGQDAGTAVAKSANDAAAKTPIEPKVDKPAAQKAGKDAGDAITKGANDAITKGDIGKTVSDDVTQSVKKSSPGKDLAKIIVDGIAVGAKQEMQDGGLAEVIVDGLAEGVKQGIDGEGLGGQVVDLIGDGIKAGNLGGTIKDAVLPTITQLGTQLRDGASTWAHDIGNSLRSGDIQGATDEIGNTVRTTTDIIATIGATFGLQLDGVKEFGDGSATTLETVGTNIQGILTKASNMKTSFADTGELLGNVLPGKAGSGAKSIINSLGTIIPIASAVFEALDGVTQAAHQKWDDDFWKGWEADQRAIALGVAPPQPGVGDRGGPPAVGQGDAPARPAQPQLKDDLRSKVSAGQLPGFSISPNGDIIGPDGKVVPGFGIGGFTGSWPIDKIAGVVHGGEYVVNADATRKALPLLELVNSGKLPGFAGGGLVGPDQLRQFASGIEGQPYVWGGVNWGDCSGAVSAIANFATGRAPFGSRFATATESAELAARGFKSGTGPAGSLSIGWYNGGPAGGHTAATLPDGTNVEMGGKRGNGQFGGGAAGANDPQFTSHAFLPPEFFSGLDGGAPTRGGGGSSPVSGGGGSSGGGLLGASAGGGGSGGGAQVSSSSGGGGSISLPSTISGLAGMGLDGLGPKTKAGPNSPERTFDLGGVAADAIGGQVSSALGVFGIGDAPPFLNALSTLVGGISVGGNSAAPTSASSTGAGTPPPDGAAHGTSAGQAPGPQVSYTINSRDVDDGFVKATRIQKERSAAKLSVY